MAGRSQAQATSSLTTPSGTAIEETGGESPAVLDRQELLLEFGAALGGDPSDLTDLPFTDRPDSDPLPDTYAVGHGRQLCEQITEWLTAGEHGMLCSEPGTGKTVLCESLIDSLDENEDTVLASVREREDPTPRRLCEKLLRAAHEADCGIDPDNYWQVDQGVPWQTGEMKQAVWEATATVNSTGRQLLLVVDGCERLSGEACRQLREIANCGVTLFVAGRHRGESALEYLARTVSGTVQYVDGIEPFGQAEIRAYTSRELASFCPNRSSSLFSSEAVRHIATETDGTPREVRNACLELFTRAALLWRELDVSADRITITPALARQEHPRA